MFSLGGGSVCGSMLFFSWPFIFLIKMLMVLLGGKTIVRSTILIVSPIAESLNVVRMSFSFFTSSSIFVKSHAISRLWSISAGALWHKHLLSLNHSLQLGVSIIQISLLIRFNILITLVCRFEALSGGSFCKLINGLHSALRIITIEIVGILEEINGSNIAEKYEN